MKKLGMKIAIVAIAALLCVAGLAACGGSISSSNVTKPKEITFGSTIDFDKLEITIGDSFDTTTVDNQFSDYYGETVIALPVTVTNHKGESGSLNMFYVKFFGANGTELKSVNAYFMDDDILWAGDARDGATQEGYFHFLYDGDGEYVIEFNNHSKKVEVKLPIAL